MANWRTLPGIAGTWTLLIAHLLVEAILLAPPRFLYCISSLSQRTCVLQSRVTNDLVVYHCPNNGHQTDRVSQCTAADHDVDPNHLEPLSPCPCCHWHNTAHNTDFESSSSKHKRTSSSSVVDSFQSASTCNNISPSNTIYTE